MTIDKDAFADSKVMISEEEANICLTHPGAVYEIFKDIRDQTVTTLNYFLHCLHKIAH